MPRQFDELTMRMFDELHGALEVYYRQVLVEHDDRSTGVCPKCGHERCAEWAHAHTELVRAGLPVEVAL